MMSWPPRRAGREPVRQLLQACAEVDKPRTQPLLARVLATPQDRFEFRYAFELSRELSGREIPAELLQAEMAILKHGNRSGQDFDQAKVGAAAAVLVASPDVQAAAHIAISLACATTKGDWNAANAAGVSILRQLPDNQGRALARTLGESCPDDWIKRRMIEVNQP